MPTQPTQANRLPVRKAGRPSYERLKVEEFQKHTELLQAQNTLLTRIIALLASPNCRQCGSGGATVGNPPLCDSCYEGHHGRPR